MAAPTTLSYKAFKVLLGNGATPEVFTAPCAMTSRSWAGSADSVDTTTPDCDDEDLVVWTESEVSSLSAQIQGSGVLAMADVATWRTWFFSGAAKNVRVVLDVAGAQGGGYIEGGYILTGFEISGERKNKTQISVTMKSTGKPVWTLNA